MDRRHFLKSFAGALCGFTILPPAETYQRIWKAVIVKPRVFIVKSQMLLDGTIGSFTFVELTGDEILGWAAKNSDYRDIATPKPLSLAKSVEIKFESPNNQKCFVKYDL